MAELAVAAVQQHTNDRLSKDDPETAALLDRGLAITRRYCGWHVTPERTDTDVKITGKGGRQLPLPTLCLVDLVSVTENGVDLDVSTLDWDNTGMVEKQSGTWSRRLGKILVEMTHGFEVAPGFEAAVLSWIDRASLAPAGGRVKAVGPFQWDTEAIAAGSMFTASERAMLELYRLEKSP